MGLATAFGRDRWAPRFGRFRRVRASQQGWGQPRAGALAQISGASDAAEPSDGSFRDSRAQSSAPTKS
eukprot:6449910-Alexandrium_andersonii.AAC.1